MPLGSGGTEKRYINGREIEIKPKQPVEIQKTINRKSFDLPGDLRDLRSTFDPAKLYKEYGDDLADAFGRDTFTSFSKMRDSDRERDKQRFYQVYRDMYTQVFIKNALDVIKNEVAQKNDENNLIKITSDNQDIIEDGEELFFDILDIDHELKTIILETCQMGENYYEIVLDNYKNPKSIVHLEYLSPERMTVYQVNGRIKYYVYTDEDLEFSKGKNNIDPWNFMNPNNDASKKIRVFMPWQIVHFKIKDRQSFPYGRSLLRAGVKDYRRLALLEDAMLVYRISRAPERRVFYVDVGQLNSVDAKIFLNKIKNMFKKEPIIDEDGQLSERANVMSLMEDFYIPVREGSSATRIETLPPGQQLNEIKDLDYFKNKLLRLLNIPMPYMGGDAEGSTAEMSRALSNIDIKFANYVEEIQTYIEKGLNKILALQLILKKYKNEDIINFKIKLTPPSNLAELIKLDFMTQQASVAATYKGLQMFSDEWIYKKIFKLSNKDIYQEQIKMAAQLQKLQQSQQQQMAQMGGMLPGMESGIPGAGGAGGEMGAIGAPPPTGAQGMGATAGGVQPPGPQIAGFEPSIYELGLKYLQENYEEIIVGDLAKKFGEGYLVEEKEDVIKLVAELKKLRKVLEDDEIKNSIKKRRFKNNFKSMVRLGEFNGYDVKNKTLKYYRNNDENIIYLKELEGDDNGQLVG